MKSTISFKFLLIAGIMLFLRIPLQAQVVIGSLDDPQAFSLLELSSDSLKGGIRLPSITSYERDSITATPEFQVEKSGKAVGLMIFNSEEKQFEYWDGTAWVKGGGESAFFPIKTITSDYAIQNSDYKILVSASTDVSITLPDPENEDSESKLFVIQNLSPDGNAVLFNYDIEIGLGKTIPKNTRACLPVFFATSLSSGGTITLHCDGTKWTGITQ